MIRAATFEECLPLLEKLWPYSQKIRPIDNSLGLMEWNVNQLPNADPRFFLMETDGIPMATMHVFRTSPSVACLRGISCAGNINDIDWAPLFSMVETVVSKWQCNKMYTIYKDESEDIIRNLGFVEKHGPFWTNDWKVWVGWRKIYMGRENRFGDKIIAEDVDGLGNKLTIWYSDKIGGCRAAYLMAQVYAELLEKGYSGPYANFEDLNNRCNVVYSTDENDQIMGGMAFEYWTPGKEGFIHLNFVDPKFRGRGISHVSRKYYQILIKQRGGNKVSSTINVNNQASWNTAIKDGMQPVYYRMHKWL